MGRGPGCRQRALLRALSQPGVRGVWVVPPGVNRSAAESWRRAAKRLVLRGEARGVYLRRRDRSGRWTAHLVLVPLDSDLRGDVLPNRSPAWIEPPSLDGAALLLGLSSQLQAWVLAWHTGQPCSASTAGRLAREYREYREQQSAA